MNSREFNGGALKLSFLLSCVSHLNFYSNAYLFLHYYKTNDTSSICIFCNTVLSLILAFHSATRPMSLKLYPVFCDTKREGANSQLPGFVKHLNLAVGGLPQSYDDIEC